MIRNSKERAKQQIRMYRWLNWEKGEGKPFTMCDAHAANYTPSNIEAFKYASLEKIADQAVADCSFCIEGEPLDFSDASL